MKNKCKCYHTQKKLRYTYNQYTGSPIPHDVEVGICWGTKECDECECGGDETKCDFYSEVREKAIREQKESNSLIVTYDCCPPDAPTLCIARKEKEKVRVLNTIQGDQAFGMYCYLTSYAELKEKEIETNADKIRSMNDEELAELLAESKYNNKELNMDEICHKGMCLNGETCASCMLKWLQKPLLKEE